MGKPKHVKGIGSQNNIEKRAEWRARCGFKLNDSGGQMGFIETTENSRGKKTREWIGGI